MHLVNIKGYKRTGYYDSVQSYSWFIFYVTRNPHTLGVTGIETAGLRVSARVFEKCGPPKTDTVYEVVYGPHDTLDSYKEYIPSSKATLG